jgi:quinol monooxygenase YgiN
MLAIVATIRTQPGKGADFEAVFQRLAAAVRQNEPGNQLYQLTRSRAEADTYKVLEIYKDDEAVAAHRAADHFREIGREMGPFMAGRPDVEILDGVA